MAELYNSLKDVIMWIFTALIGVIVWFLKGFYTDFKEMQNFYEKHKEVDFGKFLEKLNQVEKEVSKVESESKRYWSEYKITMENNQKIILERISTKEDNNKLHTQMIKEYFERLEKQMTKLEEKIDNKQDKE